MINVLSLFDGMSCGQIALNQLGIKINKYFASEIDKYGQQVSKHNYPDTVYLGDVRNIDYSKLPKIDLLIGGSPCQSFSFAGKRKGMSTKTNEKILSLEQYENLKSEGFEFEGQSYLFWEYVKALKTVKPKYFLLENVMMAKEWEVVISKTLGIAPIMINSALLSAQNRKRLYWTNIGAVPSGLFGDLVCKIPQPKNKGIYLKDIVECEVDDKYFLSDKMINFFLQNNKKQKIKGNGFEFKPHTDLKNKSKSLTTRSGSRPEDNFILGCDFRHDEGLRIKKGGKSGTLTTKSHEQDMQLIIRGCAMRERNPDNPSSIKTGDKTQQRIEINETGKSNCITSVNKDSLIITHSELTGKIRRLTPLECERLQTVPDNMTKYGIDHKTNQKVIISDTQRYKMLGNGWTIEVIKHILKYMNHE